MAVILLDDRPNLLLKLRNNNHIGFHLTKMNAKQSFHCRYASGAGGVLDQPVAFVPSKQLKSG